jgi:hypothetical protein
LISKNNSKLSLCNDNITIDAKHSEMVQYFRNQQDSIPKLKDELKKLILEYNNKDHNRKNDIDYIINRDNIKEKINELKNKINSILNNEDLNKYYLDVGTLLHSYYENIEISKNVDNSSENFEQNLLNYDDIMSDSDNENDFEYSLEDNISLSEKKNNYKSVLNFFNSRENKTMDEKEEDNIVIENKNDNTYTSMKISDFVKEESTFKKKDVLDEYLQKIDPNYVSRIKIDTNIYKCSQCNLEMIMYPSDGIQICENCGNQQNIFIESDKPSFKDPPIEVCYFSYKRINHYNESTMNDKNTYKRMCEIYNILIIIFKFLIN